MMKYLKTVSFLVTISAISACSNDAEISQNNSSIQAAEMPDKSDLVAKKNATTKPEFSSFDECMASPKIKAEFTKKVICQEYQEK